MHTNFGNDDAASLHCCLLFDATEGELATRMLYFVNEIFAKGDDAASVGALDKPEWACDRDYCRLLTDLWHCGFLLLKSS